MKKLLTLCLATLLGASCILQPPAAEKKAGPAEKSEKKVQTLPFHGKIESVNQASKTIKVGERTFHVTSTTRFIKAGKPATIDDAKAGEEVGGSYREGDGGKLELNSLRIGPKAEKVPKDDKKEK